MKNYLGYVGNNVKFIEAYERRLKKNMGNWKLQMRA